MPTAAPPDYNQVLKEREEFQRDVSAAGIAVEGAAPNTSYLGTAPPSASRPMAQVPPPPTSFPFQSPYPTDKSGKSQRSPSSTQYTQPAPTPAMGYGSTQNLYSGPQPQQTAGGPMHYYQNAAGHTIASPYPPNHRAVQCLLSRDGRHHTKNYYGVLGVVMGILFFPLGCIWTALDHQTRCKRCGEVLHTGCYSC